MYGKIVGIPKNHFFVTNFESMFGASHSIHDDDPSYNVNKHGKFQY